MGVKFHNFYVKRRRGIPDYRFPDFPTGYSQVAKSEKHVQSGRADLLVYDHMAGRRRRRLPPKGQLPYKPKFRDFFQEWNRNKAQNVFIKFVAYNLKEKKQEFAFHDRRPEVEKMRSPSAYKLREKKIAKLEKKPKKEAIQLIAGFINANSRKKGKVPERLGSDTYVERRKLYEKKQAEKAAKVLKDRLGLKTLKGKSGGNYDLPDDDQEPFDPQKNYDAPGVPYDEKFFFPNYTAESSALKAQVPVVPGNKGKKWLKTKMVMEGEPGALAKEELVPRKEDRGNLRSRYDKERYDNKDDYFGFSKYGVPVKQLGADKESHNFRRIDFDRLERPEGLAFDIKEGHFHENRDKLPKKRWRRASIHSDDSKDDLERRFKKKFVEDVQKSWRGVTGIRTLGDWYIPSGTRGYRPGFRRELVLEENTTSSSSEEIILPSNNPPPKPPPPPPKSKPKRRKPKSKSPPRPEEITSLPFSNVSSVRSRNSVVRPPKPKPNSDDMDFLFRNALKVARTPARKPPCVFVDDVRGSKHDYCNSGLAVIHVLREDYGKIPLYLQKRNIELGRPAVPDWRKFYQPNDCKFYHRHVHCKGCNRVLPVDKYSGPKMYMCDYQEEFGPCPCPEIDNAIYQSCYPWNSRVKRC